MAESTNENPRRGRPPKVDRAKIISAILKHKDNILKSDGKPVSKLDPVWKLISRELDNLISDRTLYSFVADNKDGIKEKILGTDCDKPSQNTQTKCADPLKSLAIMKCEELNQTIHGIGLDPFFIHYWTNDQSHVYRTFSRKHVATVCIDTTSGIVERLQKTDETRSNNILLYQIVINGDLGPFSVSQMLSESHDTIAITFWLMRWVKSGAPHPKEVILRNSSKPLLNAVITAFAQHDTVEEYVNACSGSIVPRCYVRIDVAHFMNMYAKFLKGKSQRVRVTYLAALGQLITACDLESAAKILESILIMARSPTEGNLPCGTRTACETHKQFLQAYVTEEDMQSLGNNEKDLQGPDVSSEHDTLFDDTNFSNCWHSWGNRIDSRVKKICNEAGDRDNAHYMPELADRLLQDVRWMPLWGCVYQQKFGFGQIPASSASVKGEFNLIKSHLLKDCSTPMRADEFVEKHVNYLNGRIKIADAQDKSNTVNSEDRCSPVPYVEPAAIPKDYARLPCSMCALEVSSKCSEVCELCAKNQMSIDTLLPPKSVQIPILKNGSNHILKAVRIGKVEVSPRYTCAFDSLLQVILAAITDRANLKCKLQMCNNDFFNLALDVARTA